eukprot:29380-Pelagococcus_subviridis.AAC.13
MLLAREVPQERVFGEAEDAGAQLALQREPARGFRRHVSVAVVLVVGVVVVVGRRVVVVVELVVHPLADALGVAVAVAVAVAVGVPRVGVGEIGERRVGVRVRAAQRAAPGVRVGIARVVAGVAPAAASEQVPVPTLDHGDVVGGHARASAVRRPCDASSGVRPARRNAGAITPAAAFDARDFFGDALCS